MSETPVVPDPAQPNPDAPAGNSGFTAPTTQEEFDAMVKDRLKREQSKFADYSDLKAKAAEFDKLTEAQKSETQRAIERAQLAESALEQTRNEALRLGVIAKHSIPEQYQEFVTGSDPDELEAKAQKVLSLIPNNPNGTVRVDPSQGPKETVGAGDPASQFAAALIQARGH